MFDWNFSPEPPMLLTLAADARLGSTTYTNDQVWELGFGKSEPPALYLHTTFGLRSRTCRIFPRFILDGEAITDPAHFSRPVTIHTYHPNYVSLSFKPFSGINVAIEYWVPSSQVVAARTKITNTSHASRNFQLEWAELLIPAAHGKRMAIHKIGFSTILAGQTSNLSPVMFLTGGVQAGSSPYPSLNLTMELPPHAEQEARWVNASLEEMQASFEVVKELAGRNWDAEFSRIQRVNEREMEITTGNQEWNTAIHLGQIMAEQLILQPTEKCSQPSFVSARHPDNGYSIRTDGSDYNHIWNGQTAFDTYYMLNFILPASTHLLRGFLDNFLASQSPTGEVDWKPGLGGQRSQLLATPLLATLAWIYYQYSGDLPYLKNIFPQLTRFYFSWFLPSHDRDNDCLPEWDQVVQSGLDGQHLFSPGAGMGGLDISTVESPDLIAYLYRESQSLIMMAILLGEDDARNQLAQTCSRLVEFLSQSWSDQYASYLCRDRDSHLITTGGVLGIQKGSGVLEFHQEYRQAVRPVFIIKSRSERTQPVRIYVHGTAINGSHHVDNIPTERIRWQLGSGFATSEYIYRALEKIEIMGVSDDVQVIIRTADLTEIDLTSLVPLWAGVPANERASILVNLTLLNKNRFLASYGLRPRIDHPSETHVTSDDFGIHLPWISLVLEGMVNYGLHRQAAEVFSRVMKALLPPLKQELKFYETYDSESGKASGPYNSLHSLLPVGLLLKIAGVRIMSPSRVEITHGNPFPWPVTIRYRGLTVMQQEKKALVIFPDGQNISVENSHPQTITMKDD